MMRYLLPVALAVALLTGSAEAAEYFTSIGAGVDSCGTWTADRRQPRGSRSIGDEQWLLGFLSGIGYLAEGADPLKGMDGYGVVAWVDNYCKAHPIEKISTAAKAFYLEHPH